MPGKVYHLKRDGVPCGLYRCASGPGDTLTLEPIPVASAAEILRQHWDGDIGIIEWRS